VITVLHALKRNVLAAAAALALAPAALAIEVSFTIVAVKDATTVTIQTGGGQRSDVRLAGISGGSKAAILKLAPVGTHGWLVVDGRKPQGKVAFGYLYLCGAKACKEAKTLLNKELLLAGAARLDRPGADADHLPILAQAEAAARKAKRGIWAK
jgi:endonuclease YncB( thermonuclease family)